MKKTFKFRSGCGTSVVQASHTLKIAVPALTGYDGESRAFHRICKDAQASGYFEGCETAGDYAEGVLKYQLAYLQIIARRQRSLSRELVMLNEYGVVQ